VGYLVGDLIDQKKYLNRNDFEKPCVSNTTFTLVKTYGEHMAYSNKVISNPRSGQDIRFIKTAKDTNGTYLEMVTTYHAKSIKPILHYHPNQIEDFKVISGEVTVDINGAERILKAGDTLHISRNTAHAMWNTSDEKTVVNWKVQPAMNTENLLENAMGLAADNRSGRNGQPNLFQTVLLANHFTNVYRVSKPPFVIQKIIFTILTPFAYLLGYKPYYPKYID
jgi:quercetin dioxygenase-like cupin family protein